jgi:drug/metabolite transporter superfamily protein YnfA
VGFTMLFSWPWWLIQGNTKEFGGAHVFVSLVYCRRVDGRRSTVTMVVGEILCMRSPGEGADGWK